MAKKIIPLFLVFCFLISGITGVSATGYQLDDDITVASGNGEATGINASSDSLMSENAGNKATSSRSSSATSTDEVISDSNNNEIITDNNENNANVDENNSKNNGMASTPIDELPGLSRYSTRTVSLAPDIAGTKYEEAAELLGALGIMVGDAEDGAFRPNDSIIRSEMAKVAVYSVGLEDVAINSNGSTRFPDVSSDHWATGAINVADQQGMVIGDDDGRFRNILYTYCTCNFSFNCTSN